MSATLSNLIELVVQRLSSADLGMHAASRAKRYTDLPDAKLKVDAVTQLRDSLETYTSSPSYPTFLKKLIPLFISTLNGQPVFISTSPEQVCLLRPSPASAHSLETAQLPPRDPPPPAHHPPRCL